MLPQNMPVGPLSFWQIKKQIFARKKTPNKLKSLQAHSKWRPGQIKDALQCTVSERANTSLRGGRRCLSSASVTIPQPEEVSSGLLESRGCMEVQDRAASRDHGLVG